MIFRKILNSISSARSKTELKWMLEITDKNHEKGYITSEERELLHKLTYKFIEEFEK